MSMSPILEPDLETYLVHSRGEYHQASFHIFKVMLCAIFFCNLRPMTLKNRPWSPILEIDLETHLVHNCGEYH